MKNFLLLLAGLYTSIVHSQTFDYLDINQVKARINSGGDLHWDPATSNVGYECPIGSGKTYWSPASLWIGGLDAGSQLKLAAQTYHQSGVDFWPGPLSTIDATTNSTIVNQYNRVWKINKSDIDDFLINVANGNVQNGTYTIPNSILNWPGNGDIAQNQDPNLAPYVDVNGDNVYDPTAGDYPLIKGDQAIFTIYNDNYLPHQGSGGGALGVEIRLLAYAYSSSNGLVFNNPYLNYTTFYNYKIINRSSATIHSTYIGLFNDTDIGYYGDDFVGCNVTKAYGYTYNNPTTSINDRVIGVVQTKGPIADDADLINNDLDGITDEPFEQISMNHFMYFNNSLPGTLSQTTDPETAQQFYQYMQSIWKDGTPLTCGGNGYGGTIGVNFAYPGNTNLLGPCGITPWEENDAGSDKKFVMSSGPFTFLQGEVEEIEYAYITVYDSINHHPIDTLDNAVGNLRLLNSTTTTKIKEIKTHSFELSPNPTDDVITIEINQKTSSDVTIDVIDIYGNVVLSNNYNNFDKATIDVSSLSQGIYFAKINTDKTQTTKKFIKQ